MLWRYDPECHILTANAVNKKTKHTTNTQTVSTSDFHEVPSGAITTGMLVGDRWTFTHFWQTTEEGRTELTETKPESFSFGITGSILTFPNSPLLVFNKTLTCQSLRSVWTSKRHVNSLIFGSRPDFESGFCSRSGYNGIDVHSSFNGFKYRTKFKSQCVTFKLKKQIRRNIRRQGLTLVLLAIRFLTTRCCCLTH